ncbi:hypothetical protein WN51_14591 [Melipona quadrifasciata]|uniref:Uncharacterized protein n=1 Tax=Melipona quadrifasciata TaxID=166423 RepID=A0A0N0BFC0_9HYME|nr:hypothetical protein WN51_14591 [Melipona quadrifasciata]
MKDHSKATSRPYEKLLSKGLRTYKSELSREYCTCTLYTRGSVKSEQSSEYNRKERFAGGARWREIVTSMDVMWGSGGATWSLEAKEQVQAISFNLSSLEIHALSRPINHIYPPPPKRFWFPG